MTTTIDSLLLQSPDDDAGALASALGVDDRITGRVDTPGGGNPFAVSLVASQPRTVDALFATALEHGAAALKPPKKSLWGYGGVLRAADGSVWKLAASSKSDKGDGPGEVEDVVVILGVEDVKAGKRFYADRGLVVGKSYGGRWVDFERSPSGLTLGLMPRRALEADTGVADHRTGLVLRGDLGTLVDPDGFAWEPAVRQGAVAVPGQASG